MIMIYLVDMFRDRSAAPSTSLNLTPGTALSWNLLTTLALFISAIADVALT